MRSESVTCWHGSRVIDSAGLTPLNAGPIRDAQHETPALLPLGVARRLILGLPGAEKNAEMRCKRDIGRVSHSCVMKTRTRSIYADALFAARAARAFARFANNAAFRAADSFFFGVSFFAGFADLWIAAHRF